VAKPLFIILYSDRWIQSIPYFQVLCIAGLAVCMQSVNLQTIAAIGKSKVMLVWVIIKRAVGLTAILGGLFLFGMKGLLCGVVFNSWFSYFVNIGLVSKHIGYKWTTQLKDLSPIFIVSSLAALAAFGCGFLLHLNMYWEGLIKLLVVIVVYLGWSIIFKPEAYNYCKTIITPLFHKFKHLKKRPDEC
jgi:O-antigen/teichoic acid export membrane protein